jgi:hypothetical protein
MPVDVTMFALNSAKTRVIAIHYGDRGTKPVYSDDGVNWNACNSGLPPDPGTTIGGAKTQGMNINPATVYVYIELKNGASTVQPWRIASRALQKLPLCPIAQRESLSHRLSSCFSEAAPLFWAEVPHAEQADERVLPVAVVAEVAPVPAEAAG